MLGVIIRFTGCSLACTVLYSTVLCSMASDCEVKYRCGSIDSNSTSAPRWGWCGGVLVSDE